MLRRRKVIILGSDLDPITKSWLQRLTSPPSGSYVKSLDTMIKGMRTDGNLTELDFFHIGATELQTQARVPIITSSGNNITEVNTPTWTALRGYTGNGTTMYFNLNWNPSTNGVKYVQDNAGAGHYQINNVAENKTTVGAINASAQGIILGPRNVADVFSGRINSATNITVANTDSRGFFSVHRTDATNVSISKNGGTETTGASASVAPPSLSVVALARNNNGVFDLMATAQLSMIYMGSGNLNLPAFYSRFQTFATEIGFNV